jgi:hypothetical protein
MTMQPKHQGKPSTTHSTTSRSNLGPRSYQMDATQGPHQPPRSSNPKDLIPERPNQAKTNLADYSRALVM